MNFAMLEMVTVVATLIREFRLAPLPGHRLRLKPTFTIRPKDGLPLLVEPVGRNAAETTASSTVCAQ